MLRIINKTIAIPFLTSLIFTGINTDVLKPLGLKSETLTPAFAQTPEEQIRIQVNEQASPAVVTIVHQKGWGSGFIITKDGLVLTNAHVLKNAPRTVKVILYNRQELIADVVGFERNNLDVAALKIRNQTNLPTLSLASPNSVKVGQSVYAIGTPLDSQFQNSFTSGVVSKVDQRRGIIQHDAAINKGNSGGPLLNSNGKVIGINTWLYNPDANDSTWIGISMAIAIEEAQPFITALKQGNNSMVAQQPPAKNNNNIRPLPLPVNGKTITATLKAGDSTLPNNTYTHVYAFQGKAGQKVTVEMNSKQLDPALLLYFPAQKTLVQQNDDIDINNFNASLVVTLPQNGTYWIFANAFEQGETGDYQLRAFWQ